MSNKRLLIHVGYVKTGSTWLQEVFFNNEKAGFLAPSERESLGGSMDVVEKFIIPNSLNFSAKLAYKVFEPMLQEAAKYNLVPVISNEGLSGNQLGGDYQGKEYADRIHAAFPEAKIFIVIREQKAILMSAYRHHIGGGGTKTIEEFIGTGDHITGYRPTCRLDHFEYDLLIEYYQKLFGSDNVLVLPIELLKKDQQSFGQKLLNFAESDGSVDYSVEAKNVGFKGGSLAFQRKLNFWVNPPSIIYRKRSLSWNIAYKLSLLVGKGLPNAINENIENSYKQFIIKRVGNLFSESNQRTNRLIDINLTDFGYD
ncbi:MAG: hypothetical protein F6K41_19545 [Symploca sp. SIO3E6]|nr:hypothetical protein [Caldora sp. SIO3E6]